MQPNIAITHELIKKLELQNMYNAVDKKYFYI